jgi:hypothetical protein
MKIEVFKINMFVIVVLFLFNAKTIFAQIESSGIAISIPIKEDVEAGDLICSEGDGYGKCVGERNSSMFGVVTDTPAASFEVEGESDVHLVQSSGNIVVKVTGKSGNISEGKLLTSSENAGIAQLAVFQLMFTTQLLLPRGEESIFWKI